MLLRDRRILILKRMLLKSRIKYGQTKRSFFFISVIHFFFTAHETAQKRDKNLEVWCTKTCQIYRIVLNEPCSFNHPSCLVNPPFKFILFWAILWRELILPSYFLSLCVLRHPHIIKRWMERACCPFWSNTFLISVMYPKQFCGWIVHIELNQGARGFRPVFHTEVWFSGGYDT